MQVFVFQNGKFTNATNVINRWKGDPEVAQSMDITYVQSIPATGYFGRFLVPLLSEAHYWAVFDDDIIFGARYEAHYWATLLGSFRY